jgi:hypothetical protein
VVNTLQVARHLLAQKAGGEGVIRIAAQADCPAVLDADD